MGFLLGAGLGSSVGSDETREIKTTRRFRETYVEFLHILTMPSNVVQMRGEDMRTRNPRHFDVPSVGSGVGSGVGFFVGFLLGLGVGSAVGSGNDLYM